jgi:hypothetical protein
MKNNKVKKVKPSYTLTREEKTSLTYNGVTFRSPLEIVTYKILQQSGLKFEYESVNYILQDKFVYPSEIWKDDNSRVFKKTRSNVEQPITHLPDFIVEDKFIVEVKGWQTPDFKLRRKMLLYKLLSEKDPKHYFMPSTIKSVLASVERIKQLLEDDVNKEETNNN